jgi:carbonic anhydrase
MQTKFPSSDSSETAAIGARPRKRLAVLTCMDARIDPLALFGLRLGDAHLVRLLDTNEIAVVMHDGCGLHGASDARFADTLAADGAAPDWRLGAFADLEQTLREGVERLRSSPELPYRESIRGFVFDPETGRVREPATSAQPVEGRSAQA